MAQVNAIIIHSRARAEEFRAEDCSPAGVERGQKEGQELLEASAPAGGSLRMEPTVKRKAHEMGPA